VHVCEIFASSWLSETSAAPEFINPETEALEAFETLWDIASKAVVLHELGSAGG